MTGEGIATGEDAPAPDEGRYLYSIINNGDEIAVDGLGVENSAVYSIPYKDIAAVVHSCPAAPYRTDDDGTARGWLSAHCYVIDWLMDHYGTVLPFSFDTIVRGGDDAVRLWLGGHYGRLKKDLARLEDKAEYTVQIFYDPGSLAENAVGDDDGLIELKEKIDKMPKGSAYLLQRKLDLKTKDAIASRVTGLAGEFGRLIRELAAEVRVEERLPSQVPEKYAAMRCVASLTCLVDRGRVGPLGDVLGRINDRKGFAVRFTGPWAPFSFVDLKGA